MRKNLCILCLLVGSLLIQRPVSGQSAAVTRLVLDVQKLKQLKTILKDMQTGYTMLSNGYRVIRDVSKGNFHLHDLFISGLLRVDPALQTYTGVADIIRAGKDLVHGCRSALQQLNAQEGLPEAESRQLAALYDQLLEGCLQELNTLAMVLTSGTLQMEDAQRLRVIDQLDRNMRDMLRFLGHVNRQAGGWLHSQAQRTARDRALRLLYNLQS